MATIKNNRNALIYAANSVTNGRLTGATVSISAGAASSILVPKGNTVPVPSSATLTAYATGYTTPGYVWEYRYGDSGTWNTLATTTNVLALTLDAAWLSAAGINTLVQYRVTVRETASGFTAGVNQSQYIQSIPIIREGADGFNNIVVQLYARTTTNTAPSVATTGQFTYYFNTGLIVGQPAGWSRNVTDGTGSYVWSIQAQVASTSTQKSLDNTAWSAPALYSKDGANGQTGNSTALVYAYKRSTTLPTDNPGAVDYSFSSNSITTATLANSWQKTIPSGTDPLYVVVATASSNTGSDSIAANEWTSPVLLAQNGANAKSIKVVATELDYSQAGYIYINSTSYSTTSRGHSLIVYNPLTDTVVSTLTTYDTYGSGTATLVTALNNIATGNIAIITTFDATACDSNLRSALQALGSPLSDTWSASRVAHAFIGQKGSAIGTAYESIGSGSAAASIQTQAAYYTESGIVKNGVRAVNTATISLYARNNSLSTAPTLTVSNSLTYTFSTGVLSGTLPSGWSTSIPAIVNGSVLWVTTATAASAGATDIITAGEWSTPKISGSVGERGTKNLYSADPAYSSSWTLNPNAAGYASFAAKATALVAAAAGNSLPTTPLAGDTVTFSNSVTSTYTGSISGYVLNVSSIASGSVIIGQSLTGTDILTGTTVTSFISGINGGAGTYGVSRKYDTSTGVAIITATSGDFVYTLTHDGTSWKTSGTVIDGSLLVTGSITASKINTNGLSIKDADGNIILAAGTALDWSNVGGTNKPADGATKNQTYITSIPPSPYNAGDIWHCTADVYQYRAYGTSGIDTAVVDAGKFVDCTSLLGSSDNIVVPFAFSDAVFTVGGNVVTIISKTLSPLTGGKVVYPGPSANNDTVYFTDGYTSTLSLANYALYGTTPTLTTYTTAPANTSTIVQLAAAAYSANMLYVAKDNAWVNTANNTYIDISGNIQGVSSGLGQSVANNIDSVIRAPGGGVFVTTTTSITGHIKITLPQSWTNTMMRFTVEIYEYSAGFMCTLDIGGYNYVGGQWYNVTARVIGGSNAEYPVYFGHDGTKCCIWIGTDTETWSYPQVRIRDFFAGYSNYERAKWESGWQISFDTTVLISGTGANQYSQIVTDTYPGADWSKIPNRNGKPADNATVGATIGTNLSGKLTSTGSTAASVFIDTGAINQALIGDLSAEKITAGYINAGRIDVGRLSGTSQQFAPGGPYTYTVPSGYSDASGNTTVAITINGGGGGGGSGGVADPGSPGGVYGDPAKNQYVVPSTPSVPASSGGNGGSGGKYTIKYTNLAPGTVLTIYVGYAGTGGASRGTTVGNGNPGTSGTSSSVTVGGITYIAYGGTGGGAGLYNSTGTAPSGTSGTGGGTGGTGLGGLGGSGSNWTYSGGAPSPGTNGGPGMVTVEVYNQNGVVSRTEYQVLIDHLNGRNIGGYTWP